VFCVATGKLAFSTEQILHLARSMSGIQFSTLQYTVHLKKYEIMLLIQATVEKMGQTCVTFLPNLLTSVFVACCSEIFSYLQVT
jgi:hypothetical protein